jgi:hypothetical protein
MQAVDEQDRQMEREMAQQTSQELALAIRDANRADALTYVSRIRLRRGALPEIWTPLEAAMAFTIADMGAVLAGQSITPLDPAFAEQEVDDQARAKAAAAERALRTGAATGALAAPKTEDEGEK